MHHDASSAGRFPSFISRTIEDTVIDYMLTCAIFPPDLNMEGVWEAITSPEHGHVDVSVLAQCAVDNAAVLELGVFYDTFLLRSERY